METQNAMDFYERVAEGTKRSKTFTLTYVDDDATVELEGVEMHPVDKAELAATIERLPEEMFEAAEQTDNPEEAREEVAEAEGSGLEAMTEDTVEAFEDLCATSLEHEDLAPPHMEEIIDALGFEPLFELGTEIIQMSIEQAGDVQDFHGLE